MTWINFADLREKVSIVDLMARYGVALKRHGIGYRGACPIHKNGKPGQFSVLPDKNMFRCFADCGVSGGVIRFVMMMERCNAREAALLLADWFNYFGNVVMPTDPPDHDEHAFRMESAKYHAKPLNMIAEEGKARIARFYKAPQAELYVGPPKRTPRGRRR
jgi:DNA primase